MDGEVTDDGAGGEPEPERCEVCGFEWDAVAADEIPARLVAAADAIAAAIRPSSDATARRRPDADTWSLLEYGCHVRDVLYNLRDRMVVGLAEDEPTPKPMFAAARLAHGLYDGDEPLTLAIELELAGRMFARTVRALNVPALDRRIFYGWPRPTMRSLRWVAAQALHEAEHHRDDVLALAAAERASSA